VFFLFQVNESSCGTLLILYILLLFIKFFLFITFTCVFFVITCTPDSLQRFPVGLRGGGGEGEVNFDIFKYSPDSLHNVQVRCHKSI
jgi:hypothetical protein